MYLHLRARSLVVNDLRSETKGFRFKSVPLPLQSCDSQMVVKENPDRKYKYVYIYIYYTYIILDVRINIYVYVYYKYKFQRHIQDFHLHLRCNTLQQWLIAKNC